MDEATMPRELQIIVSFDSITASNLKTTVIFLSFSFASKQDRLQR